MVQIVMCRNADGDFLVTNCRNSDRVARLVETCETRDESPSLNLEVRVARLGYESEMTVELITVSSILDWRSGCTINRASYKGTGILPVSIICKGVEFCDRKRFAIRENNEHAITALSKAVWQAGTKGNILENVPEQSSGNRRMFKERMSLRSEEVGRKPHRGYRRSTRCVRTICRRSKTSLASSGERCRITDLEARWFMLCWRRAQQGSIAFGRTTNPSRAWQRRRQMRDSQSRVQRQR